MVMGDSEVKDVVRKMIREEVERAFDQFTVKFTDHFARTERLLSILEVLGTSEEVYERLTFLKMFIDREKDHVKLRKAIIEKGLIAACIALMWFLGKAIWNAVIELINSGHLK